MLTYYQKAKKETILYFNFSRLGEMLRLCLKKHVKHEVPMQSLAAAVAPHTSQIINNILIVFERGNFATKYFLYLAPTLL